jgi:hypothetical protein
VANAHLAQRHKRALRKPASPISGFRVAHDVTRIAYRPQIAGDDFVEWRSISASDLDGAISRRRERYIGEDGCNVIRRDGLQRARR